MATMHTIFIIIQVSKKLVVRYLLHEHLGQYNLLGHLIILVIGYMLSVPMMEQQLDYMLMDLLRIQLHGEHIFTIQRQAILGYIYDDVLMRTVISMAI